MLQIGYHVIKYISIYIMIYYINYCIMIIYINEIKTEGRKKLKLFHIILIWVMNCGRSMKIISVLLINVNCSDINELDKDLDSTWNDRNSQLSRFRSIASYSVYYL